MNKYVKTFLLRGAFFGGFGPVVMGFVYLFLDIYIDNFAVSGYEIFLGIITTYLIAFLHAGASVFHQIESWPVPKSMFFNFITIYIAYTVGYIINSWIPFDWRVILIYTAIFIVAYFIIWLTTVILISKAKKKLNSSL